MRTPLTLRQSHPLRVPAPLLGACLALASWTCTPSARYADEFRTVHVRASDSVATQLATHACAGLYNRRLGGSVFVQSDADVPQAAIDGAIAQDELWLDALGLESARDQEVPEFLAECVADFGCVRYSYEAQQEILPSIMTVAAVRGAPMLSDEAPIRCEDPLVDATLEFAGKDTQLLATQHVYENYLEQTTGLAMLNPGYNRSPADLANPEISENMSIALVDYVFERRLFVAFLVNGCTAGHPERELLSRVVNESGWETPLPVYGYNDSWLVQGYLHEAQTRCLESANMGAIPTRTSNLSFFGSRRAPIEREDELPHNDPQAVSYDPTKVYVAFVVGDGDNVRYIMSTRRDWMEQRLAQCRDASPACPPLTWTISPHLPELAPDVLEWYYAAAESTGSDYFALPPSGHLYSYPGSMPPEEQARFVSNTERVARILGTHSVVHWEWFSTWRGSVQEFLPRYAHEGGQIQGIFPVNVPYLIDMFSAWPAEQEYQLVPGADGSNAVIFRSHSWRGVNGSDAYHPSAQEMSDRLAALPAGTVTWVYMTSDGGLTLENSYTALTDILPSNVVLVSADAAAQLALAAGGI
ncbi:MAG: hypothetical protein KC593_19310, partial [Myxococcales bacterium]|nr:hypothetical protein [Myxococcales bacterium]MCB9627177.1 hypothetical protein [Sandaracinaceae bacterium]